MSFSSQTIPQNKIKILFCGKTGVGKTSAIRALAGANIVPANAIGHSRPRTQGFCTYETENFVFIDSEGFEPGGQRVSYEKFLLDTPAHIYVYCIDGIGARIQDFDFQIIEALNRNETLLGNKVIIAFTKSESMRSKQREDITKSIPSGYKDFYCFISENDDESIKALEKKIRDRLKEIQKALPDEIDSWEKRSEREISQHCDFHQLPKYQFDITSYGGGFNEKDDVILINKSTSTWLRLRLYFSAGGERFGPIERNHCRVETFNPSSATSAYTLRHASTCTLFFEDEITSSSLSVVSTSDVEMYRNSKITSLQKLKFAIQSYAATNTA